MPREDSIYNAEGLLTGMVDRLYDSSKKLAGKIGQKFLEKLCDRVNDKEENSIQTLHTDKKSPIYNMAGDEISTKFCIDRDRSRDHRRNFGGFFRYPGTLAVDHETAGQIFCAGA